MRAVLGLGSNLGDRLEHLQAAVAGLGDTVVACSPVYETEPWGPVTQGPFLNAVVIADSADKQPADWLAIAQELEARAGRIRDIRWGPRTLDVDVISVDGLIRNDPQLTLPHPGAHERATVLIPWLALEPDAILPGHGRIADLVQDLDDSGIVLTDSELRP